MRIRRYAGAIKRAMGPFAWSQQSFAQEGEDLVVSRLLGDVTGGFYVDVGSHHPFRFSNTYLFYRKKWRGICIDPLPGSAKLFRRWRPNDIAVEQGVSSSSSSLLYYMFNEPALNTFDGDLARKRDGVAGYRIVGTHEVKTDSLASILSAHMPDPSPVINLMSVDVEGLDLQVLKSNDWNRFRPAVIIAECLGSSLESLLEDDTAVFLKDHGYKIYAKTGQSVIFSDRS